MDIKKAYEIVNSLGAIDVNYKGNSVWIENINEYNNEALVKNLKSDEKLMVNISWLEES